MLILTKKRLSIFNISKASPAGMALFLFDIDFNPDILLGMKNKQKSSAVFMITILIILFLVLSIFYIYIDNKADQNSQSEIFIPTDVSSWDYIKQGIFDCKIKSVMQTHSQEITAIFKDGKIVKAQEPEIDNIFDIINENKEKCGEIIMMIE